jgi:competence ComEA-like helix-hairpin-helix protein
MKNWLKDYFYYTRQERLGTLLLCILCLLLFIAPRLFYYWSIPPPLEEELIDKLNAWQADKASESTTATNPALFYFDPNTISADSLALLGLSSKTAQTIIRYRNKVGKFVTPTDLSKIYTLKEEEYERLLPYVRLSQPSPKSASNTRLSPPPRRFAFDPNLATAEQFNELGIPKRVAQTIIKYRNKGGKFEKPEDLKKIYGLEDPLYDALQEYIEIAPSTATASLPAKTTSAPKFARQTYSSPPPVIDINAADAQDWQQLSGIGPSYAGRIVKFREALGGFVSIEQVAETYGLPDSTFQKIRASLRASPVRNKININRASEETLKKHPYLNWKQARALYHYRNQHGPFKDIDDLRKVKALKEEVVSRLSPYLEY